MTFGCTDWEFAPDTHLLKLQGPQNKALISNWQLSKVHNHWFQVWLSKYRNLWLCNKITQEESRSHASSRNLKCPQHRIRRHRDLYLSAARRISKTTCDPLQETCSNTGYSVLLYTWNRFLLVCILLIFENTVTYQPTDRQRLVKDVSAETESWKADRCWVMCTKQPGLRSGVQALHQRVMPCPSYRSKRLRSALDTAESSWRPCL